MAVVRGANAPLLQKTVLEQLAVEKKVLEQGTERKVVSYTKNTQHLLDQCLQKEEKCHVQM